MSSAAIATTAARFRAQRIVPVFYHVDRAVALHVLEICYQAGLTAFEYTNRGPEALENFRFLKAATGHLPHLCLGVGTIFSLDEAERFLAAGADFVVSPALVPELAELQSKHNCLWIPGCATVTEIVHARALGATVIKVYPADVLGPGFVRSVKAVLPDVFLMPTGGIPADAQALEAWFAAGAGCVGLGSQLFQKELLQPSHHHQLKQKLHALVQGSTILS